MKETTESELFSGTLMYIPKLPIVIFKFTQLAQLA